MRAAGALVALLVALVTLTIASGAGGRWTALSDEDIKRLEKEWEEGDEEAELRTAGDDFREQLEQTEKEGKLGQTLMFVQLVTGMNGESTDAFGAQVQQHLLNGGYKTQVYKMQPGELILTMQRGWEGTTVYDELMKMPEVVRVDWQDKPGYDRNQEQAAWRRGPPPEEDIDGAYRTQQGRRRRRRRRQRKRRRKASKDEL